MNRRLALALLAAPTTLLANPSRRRLEDALRQRQWETAVAIVRQNIRWRPRTDPAKYLASADVWLAREGDCLEMAGLLSAACRAAGIGKDRLAYQYCTYKPTQVTHLVLTVSVNRVELALDPALTTTVAAYTARTDLLPRRTYTLDQLPLE